MADETLHPLLLAIINVARPGELRGHDLEKEWSAVTLALESLT